MKTSFIIVLVVLTSRAFSQVTEVDTIFSAVPRPVLSVGIGGGLSFINPETINDQIQFNNSAFGADELPVRTPAMAAIWLAFRPTNLPSYFSVRVEYLSFSRSFTYTGRETDASGNVVRTFSDRATSRYTLFPLSINAGGVLPKTRLKAEIGFVYALSTFVDETSMGPYGARTKTYDDRGSGFRLGLQQVMPLADRLGISIEFTYRYLVLDDMRDDRGTRLSNIEVDFSGISFLFGLTWGI